MNSPIKRQSSPLSGEMLQFLPDAENSTEFYRLMISVITPRPIAWVSTCNTSDVVNLAPYSFFNGVSSEPPCLMICVSDADEKPVKDTLRNILETQEFVVNMANLWLFEEMVQTAASYPYGISELEKAGLHAEKSQLVRPPRVKESAAAFECQFYKSLEIHNDAGRVATTVVIGKILCLHVDKNAVQQGRIDTTLLQPLGRLGGAKYSTLGTILEKPIPKI